MIRNKPLRSLTALIAAFSAYADISFAAEEGRRKNVFLEEVVVTARKKSEDSMDAPLAISAYSSDMIEAAGIKDLTEVANFTPGFAFSNEFGRTDSARPVIRGQSTIVGASGVSTFIDGVLISGSVLDYDLSDVERIEIIKGPQSALYGRNTYSGAISITTKNPGDEMSGNVKVEIAEFDQKEVNAAIRGPLIEGILSGGITARHYERGGTYDNIYDNTEVGQQESDSVSGVLYFTPTEDLDIRARSRWSNLNDDQLRLFSTTPEENNCYRDIGKEDPATGIIRGNVYAGNNRYFCGELKNRPINVDDRRLLDQRGTQKREMWESSVTVNYQFTDELSLTWVNGYNRSDTDTTMDFANNPISLAPVVQLTQTPITSPITNIYLIIGTQVPDFASVTEADAWEASSELRLAFEGERWSALIGGYYVKIEENSAGVRTTPSDIQNILDDGWQHAVDAKIAVCPTCTNHIDFGALVGIPGVEGSIFAADRGVTQRAIENQAIFAMVEYDFTDRLTTSLEVRSSREIVSSDTRVFAGTAETTPTTLYRYIDGVADADGLPDGELGLGYVNGDGNIVLTNSFSTVNRTRTFRAINPRLTFKYAATDDTNLYLVVATGTKPGGFNGLGLEDIGFDSYDQESILSYEIGAKSSLLDGRLRVNGALYHNSIDDYQLTESVLTADGQNKSSVLKNAGDVISKGVELDAIYALESIEGLTVNANYAYADTVFTKGVDVEEGKLLDVQDDGQQNCSTGYNDVNLLDPDDGSILCGNNVKKGSIVGRQLPNSSKHMANVGVNYIMDLNIDWSLTLNATASYQSKKFVQIQNRAWVAAATLVNASATIENENFRIMFWGKNLTDVDTPVSATRFADSTRFFQRNFLGSPRVGRQFGVTGTYVF